MKKIPSLFKRDYEGSRLVYEAVVEGCEWVMAGEGIATEKYDGTSCMVRDGKLYKRYDAKAGRAVPSGWEACEEDRDPNTKHWPGWLPVGDGPDDQWHRQAWKHNDGENLPDGTYELIGPKVQGNPHNMNVHHLIPHGSDEFDDVPRSFMGIRDWLESHPDIEGIVWHHPDGRMAKIKRKDFGLPWPVREGES